MTLRRWLNAGANSTFPLLIVLAVSVVLLQVNDALAVGYNTVGSTYLQDFNSLPTNTETNANIESGATAPEINYPTGWIDDKATPAAGEISIDGWYLYHPVNQAEGGSNGNQRLRFGSGSNTGSFYGLATGNATNPEKALGSSSSTTMAPEGQSMFIGFKLTNNTEQTLNRFTLTYDGEQWRDGTGGAETLSFGYSTVASAGDWFVPGNSIAASSLDFVAPVTGGGDVNIDGNVAGKVAVSNSVTGFAWAPGADLWLRWADLSIVGTDDNLAIDNLQFSADAGGVGPTIITSVQNGLSTDASTWSNNQPAQSGLAYHVVGNDTVTVNTAFPGSELRATNTGTVNFGVSNVAVPLLVVDSGGNVTETVSGTFSLGDAFALTRGTMIVNQDLTFNIDASSDFILSMNLFGAGDLNFNGNGVNSNLVLLDASQHAGTIRFGGTGDKVIIPLAEVFNELEMNSTGNNTLVYDSTANTSITGKVIFNEPGTIIHASNNNRLQGPWHLVANDDIAVDLTTTYGGTTPNERRTSINERLEGTGDITINGTAFDPTGGSVTLNEFEVGATGEPGSVQNDDYDGTITANDFVNVEIRHNLRGARLVVNADARLETGHQNIPVTRQMNLGEVEVNAGGILEVGFEQDGAHNAGILNLVATDGRTGGLTVNDNGKLLMQINGTAANLFDSIRANGNVDITDGDLQILVNAVGSPGTDQPEGTAYAAYTPVVGHTFDIITVPSGTSPLGDYNGNGTVGTEDYTEWVRKMGTTDAAADGNKDGVVDAADFVVWQKNVGQTGGPGPTITGQFQNVTHDLAGFDFVVHYLPTAVRLEIVAAGSGGTANVPEPCTLVMFALVLPFLSTRCLRPS